MNKLLLLNYYKKVKIDNNFVLFIAIGNVSTARTSECLGNLGQSVVKSKNSQDCLTEIPSENPRLRLKMVLQSMTDRNTKCQIKALKTADFQDFQTLRLQIFRVPPATRTAWSMASAPTS